ncbi:MAG: Hsp70 family protein [Myxococcaceae bacterium]|nr:Hsp70 family protein [Myxococcaceae bacterium]MCI0671861.1 Hsp70 family protein [Myxococcaceae bacterium]
MARYSIGIDLGTTHSALSYLNLEEGRPRGAGQPMLPIPQLTAPGTLEARQLLPSFLYLPAAQEFPAGALGLPWAKDRGDVVGEFARSHGARVPARLVSSAKSWLSHPGVDRRGRLLPWQAPQEVARVSPLDASARYLAHVKDAWNQSFRDAGAPLEEQDVIVTVPASFDAAARELTLEAAHLAGYPTLTLLEEPQAALYAWIEGAGEAFRKQVGVGDVILVVDVGGGTSDFSLIAVGEQDGEVVLTRVAVGDHILLGGDNMDLALAHFLNARLKEQGRTLDAVQFNGLTYAARQAKEQLFADAALPAAPVAVASRGTALIGGTVKTELSREDLTRLLTDGFFPPAPVTEAPRTARRTGLTQMALPYAQDAGITRHLAAFLTRQARALSSSPDAPVEAGGKAFLHPTAVLFNGGVFKAAALQQRLVEVLDGWLTADGGAPVKVLEGADLDLSVARGAAYYGWVRKGHGLRIRGGTAQAYYVGVETAMPAVPGMEPPVKALCVAPFGMEEGTHADVPPQEFGLVVGEPTRFRFFESSVRRDDKVGDMLEDAEHAEGLEEAAPIETMLPAGPGHAPGQVVPVHLQAAVTEVGTLELRCLETGGAGAWKLELNVRLRE